MYVTHEIIKQRLIFDHTSYMNGFPNPLHCKDALEQCNKKTDASHGLLS